jgi:hypothetical protein
MQKSHTKSFEISKLAFENISDLYASLQYIRLFKAAKELDL